MLALFQCFTNALGFMNALVYSWANFFAGLWENFCVTLPFDVGSVGFVFSSAY